MSDISKVIEAFEESTRQRMLRLNIYSGQPGTIISSKLYGRPYMPQGFEYPRDSKNRPMLHLAQINFSLLPKLEGFPDKGILQFYISIPETVLEDQWESRVVFHKNHRAVHTPPSFWIPGYCECEILGSLDYEPMTLDDFRFDDTFFSCYERMTGIRPESLCDLSDQEVRELTVRFVLERHRVGGYGAFTSKDIRKEPATVTIPQRCFRYAPVPPESCFGFRSAPWAFL